ncbi:MAG: chlorite dismutase family protein [Bacteroidota bacterium]|nr:chlorite dismutase family protein [Bacteroidota bacterium]MDE2956262.1 chlorite dismutase family protein [Bacteroidota bacterium]
MALDIRENRPAGVDLREKGRDGDGQLVHSDRRLFMQLLVFTGCRNPAPLMAQLMAAKVQGAMYLMLHDPEGVGLLVMNETPDFFVGELRNLLHQGAFGSLTCLPEWTMVGRTYAIGYEQDLEEVLIRRPRRYVSNPAWPWAMWYPLRRSGAFQELSAEERRTILMEHGGIGMAYGRADHAHDIRLACHGLDQNDNDFLVGLLSRALHPLSAIVERMRKTRQTTSYLSHIGPFFVGRACWQSDMG